MPFTFTRPVAEIRVGILKISQKWELYSGSKPGYLTQDYLSEKFPKASGPALMVNGALCPDEQLWERILSLAPSEALYHQNHLLAAYTEDAATFHPEEAKKLVALSYELELNLIRRPWQIFGTNGAEIKKDFSKITKGRISEPVTDPYTKIYNPAEVFIEAGAVVKAAVLNAENGPIYIGKNTEIQEGSLIRGPFALCEGSTVNMGAKVRGDSTVGPFSKVGGEISNAVIFGYSNKGHEGFLGNSVIGEWCNLGADTNVSNLKNNYASVKLWDYTKGGFTDTGLQFCGLMMGDHSKCGINTMFNTGTVVGVGANIFGDGFPRNFIPSFSWGGASGFTTFTTRKFDETTAVVMSRRGLTYTEVEKEILKKVFELTKHYRIWDKQI